MEAIMKADIEPVRDQWRGRRHGSKGGTVDTNRMLTRFKHFCSWLHQPTCPRLLGAAIVFDDRDAAGA